MAAHGKWSQAGVPHKGWSCIGVNDLGEPEAATCEMCESQAIRYAHTMQHPDYPGTLEVGCICAEKMEDDCIGPRKREKALRSAAGRRRRWLSRTWRTSAKGNNYVNTDGLNITIFQQTDGTWSGRIEDRATGQSINARKHYPNEAAAKLAAFDGMIFMKRKYGWGNT